MNNPVIEPNSAASGSAGAAASPAPSYRGPFMMLLPLFFLWGFIMTFNDILIPRFKAAFDLNYFQVMLVQSAFFGAYFVGALVYYFISSRKGDPIAKIGYKNSIAIGLLLSAAGAALFWPAASLRLYPMFLCGLFVIGLGLTMLQIAANPYVTILGPERTASSRLNLAQGINSIGTTTGPIISGWLIYQVFARPGDHGVDSVKVPYLVFCLVFAAMAVVFLFMKLPHIGEGQRVEHGAGALKYPHVVLGVIAIFMAVGAECATGSAIINFVKQPHIAGLSEDIASKHFLPVYWGGYLIGRFMGAAQLSDLKKSTKQILLVVIPVLAYLFIWTVKSAPLDEIKGGAGFADVFSLWGNGFVTTWTTYRFYEFLPFVALCWVMFQAGKGQAGRTLAIFAAMGAALLFVAMFASGMMAVWCVLAAGLCLSICWSNIFSLALEGMGPLKSQVSSLLVMGILGAAVLPPLLGRIADMTGSLSFAFIVPMLAFIYTAYYGAKGHGIRRKNLPYY